MGLVAIAGVPPREDMSGKLVGVGCPCMGTGGYAEPVGDTPPTEAQATAFRWVAIGLGVVAVAGLWWLARKEYA